MPALKVAFDPLPVARWSALFHVLARHHELRVAEVLDEPFPDGRELHPAWKAFWTLDAQRGGAPPSHADVADAEQGIELVAAGRAISTFPEELADGLPHPGLISLPLVDGPAVTTRLVWRADETNDAVHVLVDIARAMYAELGRR
jgi:DNA-binding transcriptional LysR family regulator